MNNCSKHKKDVVGISDMKMLAEMIGDLHYESLSTLFNELSKKLKQDSRKDWASGKFNLANRLKTTSLNLKQAYMSMNEAWQISKPFMTNNQPFGDMVKNSAYDAKNNKK